MSHITDLPLMARAGEHNVFLTQPRPGIWRVETVSASVVARPVDELTFSLADERLAKILARVITLALRQDGATVESARRAVVAHLDGELAFILASAAREATDTAVRLQQVKAMFETAADREWAAAMVADMRAHLNRVHGGELPPARSFRELRDRHTAAVERDRKRVA